VADLVTPGIGLLVGPWGIGKTPFILQLQQTLSAGLSFFLGRYKTRSETMTTVYVDFENGAGGMEMMLKNLAVHLGLKEPAPNAFYWGVNYSEIPDGNSVKYSQIVAEIVRKMKPHVVFIDPLRMYDPNAETGNDHAARMLTELRKISKQTGTTFVIIHHPGKGDKKFVYSLADDPHAWFDQACGSSALISNTDFRIGLEKQKDDTILLRSYIRNYGWAAMEKLEHEMSEDDEPKPIGFKICTGLASLSELEREQYESLPETFTTQQAKGVFNRGAESTNAKLNRWLKAKLVKKLERGLWKKLVT
jgi:hypothetical protein